MAGNGGGDHSAQTKVAAKPAPKKKRMELSPAPKPSRPASPNVDEFGLQ